MSYAAEKWAREQTAGNARAKAVLIELANCLNDNTGKCCPSVAYLSRVTELKPDTISLATRFLEEKGLIKKHFVKTRNGRAIQYELVGYHQKRDNLNIGDTPENGDMSKNGDTPELVATHTPENGGTDTPENGDRTSNKEQVIRTSNKKENIKEKDSGSFSLTTVEEKPKRRQPLKKPENVTQQTWDDFNAIRKAKKAPLTQTALVRIQNEADKAGIDLETALQVCCERGWQGFKAEWYLKDRQNKPAQRTLAQNSEPTPKDFTDKQINMFAYRISREKPYSVLSPGYCESYDQLQRRIESNLRHPENFKKFIPVLRELHLI